MTTVRAAWPQAGPIVGGAALALAVFINAISLGIVWSPLLVLTFTYSLAALLSLVVGVRIGGWSPFGSIVRFAIGVGVASAGLVGYVLTMGWANAHSTRGNTPLMFDVAFFGVALLLIGGYGIILGTLLRAAVLSLRRAL